MVSASAKRTNLGDGYSLSGRFPFSDRTNYSLTFTGLTTLEFTNLFNIFQNLAGWQTFEWRALDSLPYRTYVAENIGIVNNGNNLWTITATFSEIR